VIKLVTGVEGFSRYHGTAPTRPSDVDQYRVHTNSERLMLENVVCSFYIDVFLLPKWLV